MEGCMEITAILDTLQLYFDVMHECDMEKFDRIFHPSSSLFTTNDGALFLRPFAQYRAEIAQRTPPKSLHQPRMDKVLAIDILSPEVALARVTVRIFEKIYIDNLNLLKIDGYWMIVAKVYAHTESIT
jgi:Putative lumazine-binding